MDTVRDCFVGGLDRLGELDQIGVADVHGTPRCDRREIVTIFQGLPLGRAYRWRIGQPPGCLDEIVDTGEIAPLSPRW